MPSRNKPFSKNVYEKLCSKALADSITSEEKKQLDAWLNQSSENRAYYKECKRLWRQTDWSIQPKTPNLQKEWIRLSQSLGIMIKKKTVRQSSILRWIKDIERSLHGRYRWALASVAIVVIVTGILIQFVSRAPKIQTYITQSAEKKHVRLPDGTEVWLNSESQIQYPKGFSGGKREVRLTGEAYFAVVKDRKSFVVLTDNAYTEVLGTVFNVWARSQETRVIVKRGLVRFARSSQDTVKVNVVNDQMSRIKQQQRPENPRQVDAEHRIGWMEGRLVFEKTALSEILEEIERFYGVHIHLVDKSLEQETLTATFENSSLSTVLTSLSLSFGTKFYHRSEDQIDFGISTQEAS